MFVFICRKLYTLVFFHMIDLWDFSPFGDTKFSCFAY